MSTDARSRFGSLPFLRVLMPFGVGIMLQMHNPDPGVAWIAGTLACVAALMLTAGKPSASTRNGSLLKGLSFHMVLCLLGMLCMKLHSIRNEVTTEQWERLSQADGWMLEFVEPPEKRPGSLRAIADVWMLDGMGGFESAGRCLTYLKAEEGAPAPGYGSRMLVTHPPSPLLDRGNPGGFDARTYYLRQDIGLVLHLRSGEYVLLQEYGGGRLMRWVYKARERILGILQENIPHPEAIGIAEALLIGYRGHLDRSLSQAYAATGVIHVIAISGLHIGLVYTVLMSLAGGLLKRTALERFRPLAVIPFLWLFGIMTGASASVMRSVCMFTMMGLGRTVLGRKGRPLNTLCATAFLLLAARPQWIADIGFQLSFAAVAGIMLFHPPIRSLAAFSNPAAGHLWDMLCMTLAAQLLTTPLILHHFGRFPLLFVFTNIVAIPLSSIILMAELLLCAVAPFPTAALGLGKGIQASILWMNRYVSDMDGIPHTNLEGLQISVPGAICTYLLIASAAMAVRHAGTWILACLASASGLAACISWDTMTRERQHLLAVPHLKSESAVLVVRSRTSTWYLQGADTSGLPGNRSDRLQMENHFRVISSRRLPMPEDGVSLIEWNGKRILILGKKAPRLPGGIPLPESVSLAVLSGNPRVDVDAWYEATRCPVWVADGSNGLWKIQQWKTLVAGLPLRFHPTSQNGAFILEE